MRMHRVSLGDNPYLSDPSWLSFAKQNVPFAASNGCVFDYVTNVECCGVGAAKAQQVIGGDQASITRFVTQLCQENQLTPPTPATPTPAAVQAKPVSVSVARTALPRLTPQSLVRPIPNISISLAPVQPECSGWSQFNGWINQNPGIAALGLVGLVLFLRAVK